MKFLKFFLSALLLLGAVAFGWFLPQMMTQAQTSATVETFPVQAVNLDYNTDRTLADRLQMVLKGFRGSYELSNGRYLTADDVGAICTELSRQLYPSRAYPEITTVYPLLATSDDGISDVMWQCEAWVGNVRLKYIIDDTTGAVLQFEILSDNGELLEETAESEEPHSDSNDAESIAANDIESWLTQLSIVLMTNLGYDSVSIENLSISEPYGETFCDFVFYDAQSGEAISLPVYLSSQFYLSFNL